MSSPSTPPTREEIEAAWDWFTHEQNAPERFRYALSASDRQVLARHVGTLLSALSAVEGDVKRLEHVCRLGFLSVGEGRPGFFACKTMDDWREAIDADIEAHDIAPILATPGAGE